MKPDRGYGSFEGKFNAILTNMRMAAVLSPNAQKMAEFMQQHKDAIIDGVQKQYPELENPDISIDDMSRIQRDMAQQLSGVLKRVGGNTGKVEGMLTQIEEISRLNPVNPHLPSERTPVDPVDPVDPVVDPGEE
jgi:hypothetical protein